ncbi:hypothetical protein EMIT0P100_10980 [Pseudomonas sp. IT-P100]
MKPNSAYGFSLNRQEKANCLVYPLSQGIKKPPVLILAVFLGWDFTLSKTQYCNQGDAAKRLLLSISW